MRMDKTRLDRENIMVTENMQKRRTEAGSVKYARPMTQ